MIGKAEHLAEGANPHFIVTSLKRKAIDARTLYEQVYCAAAKWRTGSRNASSIWELSSGRRERRTVGPSYLDRDDGRQPAAAVVLVVRLRAARGPCAGSVCRTPSWRRRPAAPSPPKLLKLGARVTVSGTPTLVTNARATCWWSRGRCCRVR